MKIGGWVFQKGLYIYSSGLLSKEKGYGKTHKHRHKEKKKYSYKTKNKKKQSKEKAKKISFLLIIFW